MFFILDEEPPCGDFQFIANIISYLFTFVKYVIPVALIILAVIDVVKVVINPDDKNKKEAGSKIAKRLIYAVVLFLVPTLAKLVFMALDGNSPTDYNSKNSAYDKVSIWKCANNIFN